MAKAAGAVATTTPTAPTIGITIIPQNQAQQQQQQQHVIDVHDATTHLPTALGLRVCSPQKLQKQMQQNSNSLLKQQLRAGLKDIEVSGGPSASVKSGQNTHESSTKSIASSSSNNNNNDACAALQSLASVAERQAPNAIQPPSANNLHHQFLLHMAANPMMKGETNFFQQHHQQQQQEQQQCQQQLPSEGELSPSNLELILDQSYKSESELTLTDETAGLDHRSTQELAGANDSNNAATATSSPNRSSSSTPRQGNHSTRPVQRRRIRRKAQSTMDDQAEHLTEMSVRGLDLFRYASITEGVYQCNECLKENVQKTFKNKYSFQRHAFLYHEGKHRKVFPCPLCSKEFSRPDKMKNHMKMTHESYVSKDMASFNPLNYLINAAAAGEIHSSLFTQQQQQQQQQQLQEQQQQAQAGLMMEHMQEELAGELNAGLAQSTGRETPPLPTNIPAALMKLENEIVIKNEIIISPSPSPPPPASAAAASSQPTAAQRLEEVK